MKEWIKNRPWKKWRTRKVTFVGVLLFLVIYTIFSFIMSWYDHAIDSTVTTEVFKTGRWVIMTGTSIVLADAASKLLKKQEDLDD
nr:MAG TPA: hypothetical protein [Caudoviricetes sp.]